MNKIILFILLLFSLFFIHPPFIDASANCPSDFNNDFKINISDYTILSANFMKNPLINPETDLTGDGKTNLSDYTILIANFFQDCPTQQASPSPSASPITLDKQKIKILSISYVPILNGKLDTTNHIEDTYGEYNFTLNEIRQRIANIQTDLITTLENGSKYHGYKDPSAISYLSYQVINMSEHQEPVPLSDKTYNSLPLPDYKKMMNDHNICDYVDNQGVKEVWLWSYGGTGKSGWESNFSSPTYPDISNSNRDPNDLPICQTSYTVYDYNFGRTVSEATEDHIHQYEALFKYIDQDLFWNKFVGYFPGGNWSNSATTDQRRRCGWAHFPPNGQKDYDWNNLSNQSSDCENWDPNSYGESSEFNCQKWNCNSTDYFTWWMQNIPGFNNGIIYQNKPLRNWWEFVGNFEQAAEKSLSFY